MLESAPQPGAPTHERTREVSLHSAGGAAGGGGYHVTNTLIRATHAHRTPQAPLIAPAESASNTAASASTPRVVARSDPAMLAPAAAGPNQSTSKVPHSLTTTL